MFLIAACLKWLKQGLRDPNHPFNLNYHVFVRPGELVLSCLPHMTFSQTLNSPHIVRANFAIRFLDTSGHFQIPTDIVIGETPSKARLGIQSRKKISSEAFTRSWQSENGMRDRKAFIDWDYMGATMSRINHNPRGP